MPAGFHHRPIGKRNRNFAKTMRREATDAELAMWGLLLNRRVAGFKFRRQAPVESYILDFGCFDRKFAIEVDGSQHAESRRDEVRDRTLRHLGFEVVRYWNNDVLQRPAAVLEDIFTRLTNDKN